MEKCVFCEIILGNIPSDTVYEDERFVAFRDIHPQAPIHVLLVPRTHWRNLMEMADDPRSTAVSAALPSAIAASARSVGLSENGFRVIINCGKDGGQTVRHVHCHILGGENLGEGLR